MLKEKVYTMGCKICGKQMGLLDRGLGNNVMYCSDCGLKKTGIRIYINPHTFKYKILGKYLGE